jgi:hypothetical protein
MCGLKSRILLFPKKLIKTKQFKFNLAKRTESTFFDENFNKKKKKEP